MSEHRDAFTALVHKHGWRRGAELGVDKGILFGLLLKACPDLHLIGVDTFPDPRRSHRAFDLAQTYWDRVTLVTDTTAHAAAMVRDGSLDFVFVDADHRYEAVRDDITRWAPKVRAGGWIGGHDYSAKFPGVVRAVGEAYGQPRGRVHFLAGNIWGVWV